MNKSAHAKKKPKAVPLKRITAWSFSRYNTYQQCPRKLKLQAIDRIKEPPNDAMARGSAIHDKAERYIRGDLARLPKELKLFDDTFKRLRKKYKSTSDLVVEDNWAFTKDWSVTQWDNWAACWVRIKLDCAELVGDTMIIRDWKTGKYRPDQNASYVEQLELYALAAMLLHPDIQDVKPRLCYLDLGIEYPEPNSEDEITFTRKDIKRLQTKWDKRVKPMLSDSVFAPNPSWLCRYCFYRANNVAQGGGQCEY